MSDPKEIFLQPECCAVSGEGRLWCEHDAPEDCMDGVPWARYVHADEIERLRRLAENWHGDLTVREQQVEQLERELAEARKLLREAQGQLRDQRAGSTLDDRIDAFLAAADQPTAVKPQHQCAYCAMGVARFENSRGQWIHEFDDGTRVECTADKSTACQHDLQSPAPTVTVTSWRTAECGVCKQVWELPATADKSKGAE